MDGGLPDGMFLLLSPNEVPNIAEGPSAYANSTYFKQKERIGAADFCVATDGYFQVIGIPLIRGRIFDARDGMDAPHVAVISESLAKDRWPGQDPIGHTIEFGNMDGDMRLLTIVGIVGDTHENGLDAPPRPTVYVDLFQRPQLGDDGDAERCGYAIGVDCRARNHDGAQSEIRRSFRTFSQIYSASLGSRRFNVILIGFFGIVGAAAGDGRSVRRDGIFGEPPYT